LETLSGKKRNARLSPSKPPVRSTFKARCWSS
jgi:hypothetical protein